MLTRLSTALLFGGLVIGLSPAAATAAPSRAAGTTAPGSQPTQAYDLYGHRGHDDDDHYRCMYRCRDRDGRHDRYGRHDRDRRHDRFGRHDRGRYWHRYDRPRYCWYRDRHGWYRDRCHRDRYYSGGYYSGGYYVDRHRDGAHASGGYDSHRRHPRN